MKEKHNITIPFPQPGPPSDAQYKFAYKKPSGMHLVGSYALKSISRARKPFNVDVAVEMPSVSIANIAFLLLADALIINP
jgi:U3 small nucleolar RNA-associated protein 22